jgi:uncharacterized protein (UPF0548 family)
MLLERSQRDRVTYAPTGSSLSGPVPPGLTRRQWSVELPVGSFDCAVRALHEWEVHRGSGLAVLTDGDITVGTNVAMSAPLPVGFIDVTCRIVAVVGEPDRFGFAYGTLRVHPEQGEEAFLVTRNGSSVRFDVVGVSRPVHPLARIARPAADRLQDAAVRRYLKAMRRAVTPGTTRRP